MSIQALIATSVARKKGAALPGDLARGACRGRSMDVSRQPDV